MPDLFRHPTLNERYRLRHVGPRNKSGVTVGGGLLAFLPRLLRIRREQVPEIIALVPKRRGVAVGHRAGDAIIRLGEARSEEHTSELQSLMRISYAVFCLKQKK